MIVLFFILISASKTSASSPQRTDQISALKQFSIGACAGLFGTLATEPLVYVKNTLQREGKVSANPQLWFRGLFINASGSVPGIALQTMSYQKTKEFLAPYETSPFIKELLAAGSAGVSSALVVCPRDLLVIQQQIHGGTWYNCAKTLLHAHSFRVLYCGFTPTVMRTSSYATFLFIASPSLKKMLTSQDTTSSTLQTLAAPAIAGMCSACITHPLDTIKTYQQTKLTNTSMLKAARILYHAQEDALKKRGVAALYKGLIPRLIGVPIGMVVVSSTKDYLQKIA